MIEFVILFDLLMKTFLKLPLSVLAIAFSAYSFLSAKTDSPDLERIIKDFEKIAVKAMEEEKVPGLVMGIVSGDKVVYLKGFGVKKVGSDDKIDPDTVFQLASVTKPLVGTVVAAAVSQGMLSWNDTVKTYVPNFKMKEDWVTDQFMIRDALSHRSGFRPFTGDDLESIGYSLNEIIDRFKYVNPVSSFRSQYAYQNEVITIGALAAANAAKKDFNLLAKDVLLDPLDMYHTGFFFKDYENAQNKAYSHVKDENGNWAQLYTRMPDEEFGGGGASSSARDMCNWLIMYLNNGKFKDRQVIDEKDLLEAHTPQILTTNTDKLTGFYAMGIVVDYQNIENYHVWKHSGAFTTGIRSIIYMLPEEKIGIVILTNVFPSGLPEGLARAFTILYKTGDKAHGLNIALGGKNPEERGLFITYNYGQDKELAESGYEDVSRSMVSDIQSLLGKGVAFEEIEPALPLERYVGIYKSNYYDLLEVKLVNEGLEAYVGKNRTHFNLKHTTGNIFSYEFLDTSKEPQKGLFTFEVDNQGNVTSVKLEYFDADVFTKVSEKK